MTGIVAYILSLKKSKSYTDEKISQLPTGFHIKEPVDTYDDLPMTGNEIGDVRQTRDDGAEYYWTVDDDGVGHWNPFHLAVEIDDHLDEYSGNAVENKIVTQALNSKQNRDTEAEVGNVAIFNNEGDTVDSGAAMYNADVYNVLTSEDGSLPTDAMIPTALWAHQKFQDKTVTVGSSTTTFVDSQEVPVLDKTQVQAAYNAFIFGKTVLVMDTLHNNYYTVHQALHRVYDATTELTISICANNAAFIDYTYDDTTDTVTISATYHTVSQSDKDYWDAKQDKATVTKTTSNDVVLSNNDTTVITQQLSSLTVGFDLPDDAEEDYVSSVIFKPYDVFIFSMDEPENYAVTWGGDTPSFDSGSVYEVVYKILGIADPQGNTLISAKWSKVA